MLLELTTGDWNGRHQGRGRGKYRGNKQEQPQTHEVKTAAEMVSLQRTLAQTPSPGSRLVLGAPARTLSLRPHNLGEHVLLFTFYTRGNSPASDTGCQGGGLGNRHPRRCGERAGQGKAVRMGPVVTSKPEQGAETVRAGGHYLLPGAPLRRRRGPGPHGAGSGSRVAGKAPQVPPPNTGSR